MRRALFLDRDGVINIDYGYVHKQADFVFIDSIFDLCRCAVAKDYRIIIVTNQAGIARGYYDETQFFNLMKWVCQRFDDEGIQITHVYHCPYHPVHGLGTFKKDSKWRKPKPGMILAGLSEFDLDAASSVLIGDRKTDIAAGKAAGLATTLLFDPEDKMIITNDDPQPTSVIQELKDATEYL